MALRWASRLMRLWTASLGPFGSLDALSQTSMMAPQSSDVRFSSVALAVGDSAPSACLMARVAARSGLGQAQEWVAAGLTDDLIVGPRSGCSEHGGQQLPAAL